MAKIKVHELAKELDIKSKDIIGFLQEKGVEVKAAQSSVEDDAVEWVRKKFGAAKPAVQPEKAETAKAEVPKAEPVKAEAPKAEAPKTEAPKAEAAKAEAAAENAENSAAHPQKKAKTIIVLNNPQNSRMNQNRGGNDRRNNGGNNNRQGSYQAGGKTGSYNAGSGYNAGGNYSSQGGYNAGSGRNHNANSGNSRNASGNTNNSAGRSNAANPRYESRPLIKPLTRPTQPQMQDEKLLSIERAAKAALEREAAAQAAAEKAAAEKAAQEAAAKALAEREAAEAAAREAAAKEDAEKAAQEAAAKAAQQAAVIEAQTKEDGGARAERVERVETDYSSMAENRNERTNQNNRNDQPRREGRNDQNRGERGENRGYGARDGQNRGDNRNHGPRDGARDGQNRGERSENRGYGSRDGQRDGANRGERSENRGYGARDGANRSERSENRGAGYGQNRNNQNRDGQSRDGQNRDGQNRGFNRDNNRDNRGARPGQDRNQGDGQRRENRGGFDGGARSDQGFNRSAGGNAGPGRGPAGGGRPVSGDGRQNPNGRKPAPSKGFAAEAAPTKDNEKRREDRRVVNQQEKDRKSKKDAIYEEDGNSKLKNTKKAGRFIKPEPKVEEPEEAIKTISVGDSITLKELAEKMKMQPAAIIKKLFMQGKIVTVNQELSYEDAENIAIEFDIMCEKEEKIDKIEELLKEDEENEDDMITRPPVICVMGHVDHGKTSLLDAIRKTNVTDREAGGITQHIGAYTVSINGQKITFLDTPGHEAFTAMRMRGASSTDIAVLVVAADDGVMPQTVEAISHAKAAGVEVIVAVNKIDKPAANIERVKQELTEYGLIAEDWGGSTVFAPVSAKTGEGITDLLEMILLTAEVLELKANPNRRARGLVIEAELDKGRGPVARVLVQKGTLHVGDFISAGASSGKVRAMIDDKGRRVKEATPSTPVEILGLSDVPNAGEVFLAHESDKEAKSYAEAFVEQNKERKLEETKSKMSLDDLFSQIQEGNLKELNLIVKADVQGSVEAVKQSLLKLSNEEVVVKCIHGGVGAINESDVSLASASNAIIIGFNVRPDATAKATAEQEGVDVRLYRVIYQAIEDIEAAMKGMLDPVFEEKVIGHAEVRQIFRASAIGNIAGSYILDGMFQRNCKVRITREGEQIYEGTLASVKRFKDDVKEVKAGFECGLVFDGFDKMQELDIVEAYIMVEVPR